MFKRVFCLFCGSYIFFCSSTSGEYIAQNIVDKFNEFGLVIDNLRGQGYNGAGNMAGKFFGVQARIKQIVLSAEYVCYAHCLNLSVVKSCQLPLIRNMMDTVKEISYAFSYSAERSGRFKTFSRRCKCNFTSRSPWLCRLLVSNNLYQLYQQEPMVM